ncbi:hypothetical protein DTO164E3_5577 [Paecilomyces variotii]|nr:hypothetical protein DTO164E3_5577 [Paecilomyces variotii]KAJ9198297.1 hypothetical protein DTO032I3_5536 [Paecilomyces variotii]KAJ9222065.1 hypothetical protein DTO169C6_5516 [Paecilomyces variotii]KAJ9228763.1 hypothetical protein DTO169E5_9073 [Paecilomyces variotii]KAJ9236544.1 hypothetical protein DTO166G5_4009 [Paecilomyces variotii]
MILRHRRPSALILLLALVASYLPVLVLGSTPASFCKCTCFSNSTIIQLGPADPRTSSVLPDLERRNGNVSIPIPSDSTAGTDLSSSSSFLETREKDKKYRAPNCNDCNRKFCLDYNLPICKGAKEEDVFTTCFQRDSRKDEAVVFIFIFATGGLLAWAAVKPWAQKWLEAARERRSYAPVSESGDN